MPKIYGRKSEYLVTSEKKHAKRSYILGIFLILLFILDIIFLFNQKHLVYSLSLSISTVLLLLVFLIGPRATKEQDKSDHFYYGAKAESFIFFKLYQLSREYSIFQDVKIPGRKDNIDFVVVGPTGIFTIEVKSHKGIISFDGSKLIRDILPLYGDFLKQAMFEALNIHDYLRTKLEQDIFVQPVLVFSSRHAKLNFNPGLINNVFVLSGNDIENFLIDRPQLFNLETIQQLEQSLRSLITK